METRRENPKNNPKGITKLAFKGEYQRIIPKGEYQRRVTNEKTNHNPKENPKDNPEDKPMEKTHEIQR